VTSGDWGVLVYDVGAERVLAHGRSLADGHFDAILPMAVERMVDAEGSAALEAMLTELDTTDFGTVEIGEILKVPTASEPWRVGEAIAEAFLVDTRSCRFPWPTSRDMKNPSGSPSGCDMVGFHVGGEVRFAFAEVKTSTDVAYPPSVVHGRIGLTGQLEAMMGAKKTTRDLIRYLGFHASLSDWSDLFKQAAQRYLKNPGDLRLYGFLIRDVEPDDRDLSGRVTHLKGGCQAPLEIELYALYLPAKSIVTLPARAAAERAG
jgi:hypothetical protein